MRLFILDGDSLDILSSYAYEASTVVSRNFLVMITMGGGNVFSSWPNLASHVYKIADSESRPRRTRAGLLIGLVG